MVLPSTQSLKPESLRAPNLSSWPLRWVPSPLRPLLNPNAAMLAFCPRPLDSSHVTQNNSQTLPSRLVSGIVLTASQTPVSGLPDAPAKATVSSARGLAVTPPHIWSDLLGSWGSSPFSFIGPLFSHRIL